MRKNVLVTAVGSFAAGAVIASLKKQGFFVVGCDIYPREWVALSLDVDVFVQAEYAAKEKEYMGFVLQTCIKYDVFMILPLTDVEVDTLNRNREVLRQAGIQAAISEEAAIGLCRNKFLSEQYLREKGVCLTIPTQMLKDASLDELSYPLIVKPCDGRSSQGLKRIKSQREMSFLLENLGSLDGYVVQPVIEGEIVTVDIVRQPETGICVCLARKELLRTLNGAGTSVEVFRSEALEAQCREIANALGVKGCVNFEFVEDGKGEWHFLECNPRFAGGVAFSCMAGYDMVENHVNCFTGVDIDRECTAKHQFIARKYHEYVTDKE